jgi:hypothetical protein
MRNALPSPDDRGRDPATSDRLDSRKEIGAYAKRDVATVQRWEREKAAGSPENPRQARCVYAFKAELESWWNEVRPDRSS